MPITVQTLSDAVARSHARIERLEDQLNAADAILGDGDTGSMLARVIEKMAATDLSATSDIGAAFNALARAIMSATGSSLGTLLATGLLALAKATKGRSELPWIELSGLIGQAIEAMRIRGGASLGDKTILDALQSVAQSLAEADINIAYAYCTATPNQECGCLVIRTDQPERAHEILSK